MPPTTVTVRATDAFASELADARRLGFRLQVNIVEPPAVGGSFAVAVRAMPATPRATAAVAAATGGEFGGIEATANVDDGQDVADALRLCIAVVLDRAREVI